VSEVPKTFLQTHPYPQTETFVESEELAESIPMACEKTKNLKFKTTLDQVNKKSPLIS
jgi:hypothetical protein